ncbi:MAG: class II aldolase/adducin family protein [Terrimicrobiaceae bacterium]
MRRSWIFASVLRSFFDFENNASRLRGKEHSTDVAAHLLEQRKSRRRGIADTPTHRHLFQVSASIRAVVHTHSRNAVSFLQAGKAIPCLGTTLGDYFYDEVPVTRPMTPEEMRNAYEWETGNVIVERLGSRSQSTQRSSGARTRTVLVEVAKDA